MHEAVTDETLDILQIDIFANIQLWIIWFKQVKKEDFDKVSTAQRRRLKDDYFYYNFPINKNAFLLPSDMLKTKTTNTNTLLKTVV